MKLPRILLCAGASGSGKTLITCGLLQALKDRSMDVCSFKCGPDYIDPMFHRGIIGTKTGNLDSFFAGEKLLHYLMGETAKNCDMAVIEGVMGYYDGIAGITQAASAYDVGRITRTPAILIVNTKGMSGSTAAFIRGFKEFKKDSSIKGVILNQTSKAMYLVLKEYIERECDVKVVGYLPKVEDCLIESRYLGLVLPEEIDDLRGRLTKLAEILRETIDFEILMEIANSAPEIDDITEGDLGEDYNFKLPVEGNDKVRIAVARDEAFCFIYDENLRLLEKMGAEIVEFSPVHDDGLPENVHGLLLYGGYPELVAHKLCNNESMKESIRRALEEGMPVMAECGGFMYLHNQLEGSDGKIYEGLGLIDGKVFKTPRLTRFGYINLEKSSGEFFDDESNEEDLGTIPAHEFHYYDSTDNGDDFLAKKPSSKRSWKCIHSEKNLLVGFPHMFYYGNPRLPKTFLLKCLRYSKN